MIARVLHLDDEMPTSCTRCGSTVLGFVANGTRADEAWVWFACDGCGEILVEWDADVFLAHIRTVQAPIERFLNAEDEAQALRLAENHDMCGGSYQTDYDDTDPDEPIYRVSYAPVAASLEDD